MEPTSRIATNQSRKSYLERELIVSLDSGPMISQSLEMMDTHHEPDNTSVEHKSFCNWKLWSKRSTYTNNSDVDPKNFPIIKKNTILFLVAIGGAISPVSTTIYYPALITMQHDFQTTDITLNASLSIYTFFSAFFPLVWATFGDLFGRRRIYIISFFISVVGSVGCALSVNAEMFIVFRAVSAIGSCSAMSMGAGTIADIFEPGERGRAFAYYTCGPLLGPALGPIIGGYLNEGLGWRSNFWFLAIFCFMTWLGIVFFLPETWRAPITSDSDITLHEKPASLDSSSTLNQDTVSVKKPPPVEKKKKIVNPIGALKLFLFPNIALAVSFVGVLFFVLYLNSTNFTRTYSVQYGMSSGLVGVCYLPSAVGSMIGGIAGGRMSDRIYNKRVAKVKETNQPIYPEMRLGGVVFYGSILLQLVSFIAYGWCVEKNVHFAYGLVCQFFRKFSFFSFLHTY
ncbi:major facilitator superfamily domain-containing protein [Helicostylum pulchrum]|nr:major facilitator superfamily domain-containing protein [Helicostylum pulchrum]